MPPQKWNYEPQKLNTQMKQLISQHIGRQNILSKLRGNK